MARVVVSVVVAPCAVLAVPATFGLAGAQAADPTTLLPTPPGQLAASGDVRYQLPADDAPVQQPFAAPSTAFGSGHRGVDLDAPVRVTVRAAADGTVTYAGPIAGTTWVAIAHADGVVTSYGPIAHAQAVAGQQVLRGQPIGTLAAGGHGTNGDDAGLHWGARRNGVYIDPMALLDVGVPRPSLVGEGGWEGTDHAVIPYEPWGGARAGGWTYASSPTADRVGFSVPPGPNHLVMIAGLSSSSATVPIDPSHLGYDPRSVTMLSYAGRAETTSDPADPRRDQRPYGPRDTALGVDAAARLLGQQLRAQAEREPGRAVDLMGHSMGGVVILHYLANYHDAYDPALPPIGHVVTIAAPLQGSDLAALATGIRSHSMAGPFAMALADLIGGSSWVPADAPAIGDLASGSSLLRQLAPAWETALHDGAAGPLAMGTRVLTIGGGGDHMVGTARSSVPRDNQVAWERRNETSGDVAVVEGSPPGGVDLPEWQPWDDGPPLEHRVLPGDHQGVLETEAVREVIWRFLAGEEVVASPGRFAELVSDEAGVTLRLTGKLVELHDLAWAPLRRAARPTPTVGHPRPSPPAPSHLPSSGSG